MAGCPLWVISGCCRLSDQCPLYPQKRTRALQLGMSAMGQKRTSAILFNQFVGAAEHRLRHGDAKRLRGLEVDNQFIFGRRLNRDVGWLLALEDAVDIAGSAPALIDVISSVGDQTAGSNELPFEINGRQLTFSRKLNDEVAMNVRQPAPDNDQTTIQGTGEGRNRVLNLGGVAQVDLSYLYFERRRHGLNDTELGSATGYARIPKHRRPR